MRIPFAVFARFKQQYYGSGARLHYRFGQMFLNTFYRGVVDSTLFFQEDNKEAERYILLTYVTPEGVVDEPRILKTVQGERIYEEDTPKNLRDMDESDFDEAQSVSPPAPVFEGGGGTFGGAGADGSWDTDEKAVDNSGPAQDESSSSNDSSSDSGSSDSGSSDSGSSE